MYASRLAASVGFFFQVDREVSVPRLSPEKQRQFAVEVVERLRAAGFEAYWAGGCVRDRLMGREPKDYDVATNATPPQIRQVFGPRKTLAIGAAFGVITVLGPIGAGQIEVATFRQDAAYSDGRRPDGVTFSTAEEDVARRDFTINGLFCDPIEDRVIDFVGGQADLANRTMRAIGDPVQRFEEDKLRLLRAIRFAAAFEFEIEPGTLDAIGRMASQIVVVSAERIAAEMQRMLVDPHRTLAVRRLRQTGLMAAILPEIAAQDVPGNERFEHTLAILARLCNPGFPLALACLLHRWVDVAAAEAICRRWRLSNQQSDRVVWLVEHQGDLWRAGMMRWSALQPLLAAEGAGDLVALCEATSQAGLGDAAAVDHCRQLLQQPRALLDPPPLLSGNDLIRHGIAPGPVFHLLLDRVRQAQLDREIQTQKEAFEAVDRILHETAEKGTE
jgi:tRNA nucleotidyltransferase/poly(A) polymerase